MSERNLTVGEAGEEALVSKIVETIAGSGRVIVGPGDDCAVIELSPGLWQLLKTDCLVEGVHFSRGTDPKTVGAKALKRVISDIAAMGGRPREAVVTLALNEDRPVDEVLAWYAGMGEVAEQFQCAIVGGETAKLPGDGAMISVAMTGEVALDQCVLRSGAKRGDLILVTGRLGGSFESGRHLSFTPRVHEAAWLIENFLPSAMMDLSDGLGSDLPRLAGASGEGYTVDPERIPCHEGVTTAQAVSDGEDYELLFTIAPEKTGYLMIAWAEAFPEVSLTVIGEVTENTPVELERGWEHYQSA
ncbi:MAG: thiamine-phosphate kinase [Verrucomicrobiales bacterium]|nr:thiamine-phosphate kinase [Verrucomicrobiales bacterium]